MAKSARASVKKSNRTKLRARVFAPVEAARLERLHKKLLEAAQQPKPEKPAKNDMEVDSAEDAATNQAGKQDDFENEMDIDGASARTKTRQKDRKLRQKARQEGRRKPKNQMAFPKSRGKGALKPFSESRVRKRT